MKLELQGALWEVKSAEGDKRGVVEGVAVPWNQVAIVQSGQAVKFLEGSLPVDGPNPKFILDHDLTKPLGMVTERVSTSDGMMFSAQLYPTTLASETLLQAGPNNFYDSVSVGVEPLDYTFEGSTMVVKSARWMELSLLPFGAFEGAKVAVAASEPEPQPTQPDEVPEEETMSEATPVVEAAPAAEAIPTLVYATAQTTARIPSAAEYIAGIIKGGEAAEAMRKQLRAAAPSVTTADDGGLLPEILTSPVYDNFQGQRPVVDALSTVGSLRAMPTDGAVFRVPYVSTHSSIGQQAAELDTLQASLYAVSSYDVTKLSFGGYSNLSEQIIDWSSPEIIGSMLNDMARVYAYQTDNYAADQLLAGCSQSAVLTDPTSPAEWVSDIYDAAVTIINNSNGNVPTHLFLAPNMFAALGKLVDSTGRPLLAPTMPMNAYGSQTPSAAFTNGSAFGLTVVVDRAFASDTCIVGDPSGYIAWEQSKGAISLDNPSNLSRTIAFRGYFATKMVDATKFVKLT